MSICTGNKHFHCNVGAIIEIKKLFFYISFKATFTKKKLIDASIPLLDMEDISQTDLHSISYYDPASQ